MGDGTSSRPVHATGNARQQVLKHHTPLACEKSRKDVLFFRGPEKPAEPGTPWTHNEYRTVDWRTWVGHFSIPFAGGDFDDDGDVDLFDVAEFMACYSGSAAAAGAECDAGEFGGGDSLDRRDFAVFHALLSGPQ